MHRTAAAFGVLLGLSACGSPTRPGSVVEAFSGVVADAPMSEGAEHSVAVTSEGALTVKDAGGNVLADTLGRPGGSPLTLSARVAPGALVLVVGPRFRDWIGFYCLATCPTT